MDYKCEKCGSEIKASVKKDIFGLEYRITCHCGGKHIRQMRTDEADDEYDVQTTALKMHYEHKCKECDVYYVVNSNRILGSDMEIICACGKKCYSRLFDSSWRSDGFIETPRSTKLSYNKEARKRFLETCSNEDLNNGEVNRRFPKQV